MLKAQEQPNKSHFRLNDIHSKSYIRKVKRITCLRPKYENPNFLNGPTQEWSQDLQKPQNEPKKPIHLKTKEPIWKKGLQA